MSVSAASLSSYISPREQEISKILAGFGDAAVGELVPLLDEADPRKSAAAARCLQQIGVAARPAIPALGRALTRGVAGAAGALAATKDDAAIRLLAGAVVAGQPVAVRALIKMGPAGQSALGEALALTPEADHLRRELGSSVDGLEVSTLVPRLAALARNEDPPCQRRVRQSLLET